MRRGSFFCLNESGVFAVRDCGKENADGGNADPNDDGGTPACVFGDKREAVGGGSRSDVDEGVDKSSDGRGSAETGKSAGKTGDEQEVNAVHRRANEGGEDEAGVACDGSVGVRKSFDGSASTKWNPQAKGSYADNPGLIYRLNRPVDLKDIVVTVASHNHYFDVYTSSDCGATYQLLASVNAETAAQYYNGAFVCTIDGQGRENVTHVKFMFTGRANGSTFMNWCEVAINE